MRDDRRLEANGSTVNSDATDWLVVLIFSSLFALAIGFTNGEANHSVYLLPGLHSAYPDFLAFDWYVTQTAPPIDVYSLLISTLARTGQLEIGLALGATVLSFSLAIASYMLARKLYEQPLVPWLLTLVLLAATGTRGVGLVLLVSPRLEPSTIAGVALVFGLLALASDWPSLVAGALFGLAAVMHAHFAVLLIPIVGLVAITYCSRGRLGDAVGLLVPFLLLGLPNYLNVIQFAGDPLLEKAETIGLARFPHHFDPRTWGPGQSLALALIVLSGLLGAVIRPPRLSPSLRTALVAVFAIAMISLAVGHAGLSRTVLRLFPWRLSTVVILFSLLFAFAAGSRVLPIPRRLTMVLLIGLLLGCIAAAMYGLVPLRFGVAVASTAAAIGWLQKRPSVTIDLDDRDPSLLRWVPIALALIGILPSVADGIQSSHFEIRVSEPDRAEVYSWISGNAPEGAIFISPPGWIDFRLVAERAIVVDHKATPVQPVDLIEWADRIQAVTGLPPGSESMKLDAAYFGADCARLRSVRDRFAARYAIRSRVSPQCGELVYKDSLWVVVDMGSVVPEPSPDP